MYDNLNQPAIIHFNRFYHIIPEAFRKRCNYFHHILFQLIALKLSLSLSLQAIKLYQLIIILFSYHHSYHHTFLITILSLHSQLFQKDHFSE